MGQMIESMTTEIKLCRHCGLYDYWEKFRWKDGRCLCRRCYKADWEKRTGKKYVWNDLDGDFPTEKEIDSFKKETEAGNG